MPQVLFHIFNGTPRPLTLPILTNLRLGNLNVGPVCQHTGFPLVNLRNTELNEETLFSYYTGHRMSSLIIQDRAFYKSKVL